MYKSSGIRSVVCSCFILSPSFFNYFYDIIMTSFRL
nr:MAG TPA_asm: hypothetical protein [Caudoviricetes sp.]